MKLLACARLSWMVLPLLAAVLGTALPGRAGAEPPGGRGPQGEVVGSGVPAAQRDAIAWYGTWAGAKAEAARTGKPILLVSAAPHCHGISGVW
ncbi:MAG: hypothetical protein ACKOSS_06435 [Planctomycetia bacterium]